MVLRDATMSCSCGPALVVLRVLTILLCANADMTAAEVRQRHRCLRGSKSCWITRHSGDLFKHPGSASSSSNVTASSTTTRVADAVPKLHNAQKPSPSPSPAPTASPNPSLAVVVNPSLVSPAAVNSPSPLPAPITSSSASPVLTANPSPAPAASPVSSPALAFGASPSPAPATRPAAVCHDDHFEWPDGSGYCWRKRDSFAELQGPGYNLFKPENVAIDAVTGQLRLSTKKDAATGQTSCGEVRSADSFGFGDYIFEVETDPSTIHHNLVGGFFVYQNTSAEFDLEYARWGLPDINNTQYVIQPYQQSPEHRCNMTGGWLTHRLRWGGGDNPSQLQFETYAADGALLHSWTGASGNNFIPGGEHVHLNHWIFQDSSDLPLDSTLDINCFKFCPLHQQGICSTALGIKPICSTAAPAPAAAAAVLVVAPQTIADASTVSNVIYK